MIIITLILVILGLMCNRSLAIQSNNTCSPEPVDKRQLICSCVKQLQLKCAFKSDILLIDQRDLDRTLRPVTHEDVSLERLVDPVDSEDINQVFLSHRQLRNSNATKIIGNNATSHYYLYFPNFNVFNSPYISVTLSRFIFIPSYALGDENSVQKRKFESVVFELQETYDFGIEQFAFTNTRIDNSLIIEGPFNYLKVHKHAFHNALITELIIGCYCIECESFSGDCAVMFNQNSTYPTRLSHLYEDSTISVIKSLKLFSVNVSLTLADLPSVNSLEELEITNARQIIFPYTPNSLVYTSLQRFTFKNNKLTELESLIRTINPFRQLKYLALAQNSLSKIDALNSLLSARYLIELSLERNAILKLPRFKKFANLRVLILNSNRIGQLDDYQFQDLTSLTVLDLSHNRIAHLNRNTFHGLKNLKQLLLSFNPFKSFAVDTFKHVAGLTRLDLVSNQDADWFTFDNEDVCLLSYFNRCEQIQIHVNSEQTCNCFVKYADLLSTAAFNEEKENGLSNCKQETGQYNNLNRIMEEMNRFYYDPELEDQPPVILDSTQIKINKLERFREMCADSYLNKCDLAGPNACLVASVKPFQAKSGVRSSDLMVKYTSAAKLTVKEQVNSEAEASSVRLNRIDVDGGDSSALTTVTVPDNSLVTFLLAGLLIVFLLSFSSLVIGVVLLFKRKKYNVYTVASNGYPNDER